MRCALLGIKDPALQCKLFDTLVLPIMRYGCEVWAVNFTVESRSAASRTVAQRLVEAHVRC